MTELSKKRTKRKFRLKPLKKKPPRTKLGRRIKDPFGNLILLKRALTSIIGIATYRRLNIVNKMQVEGMEVLRTLPRQNVLFVSNHQTYFADVFALNHIFSSDKWRLKNIKWPIYLLMPRVRSYYIAAEETMKNDGLLPKIFSYAGAVLVKRSWRSAGKDVQRSADFRAPAKIKAALSHGWVINFPQGTTTPDAPVRKGTANLIKSFRPIVVPVKLSGFNEAFDKKGLKFKEKGTDLCVSFGQPVQFDESTSKEAIHQYLEAQILGLSD
ncbi:MAG: lysophospholipid acyltransferase family protein [Bacteroidota bacterium]